MSLQLSNHLVANRKRLALSQEDVAFLLGLKGGDTVSRYESGPRAPSLEAALAFEIIFKRSVAELFPGFYQRLEAEISQRAKSLAERKRRKTNQSTRHREETLLGLSN